MATIMRVGGGAGGGKEPTKTIASLEEGALIGVRENGTIIPFILAKKNYEPDLNGNGRYLFVRKNPHSKVAWNSGGLNTYANGTLDSWFNNTYLDMLTIEVRSQIKTTKFYYAPGNGNFTVTTLERAIFALSGTEYGSAESYMKIEGSKLPYADDLRTAYYNDAVVWHWTRSPYAGNSNSCYYADVVKCDGDSVKSTNYARPAFTLPSTMEIEDEPNADGSYTLSCDHLANIVGALGTGDIIRITENGIPTEYYIAKHGYEPELNGANRTLLVRKECHSNMAWDAVGSNALVGSDVDEWLNGDFFNSLSSGVRDLVGVTEFEYTVGGGDKTQSTLKRAVFQLSIAELGLTVSNVSTEGTALPIASTLRIATQNGSAANQWTRSILVTNNSWVAVVNTSGAGGTGGSANTYSVRPIFTIPHDAKLAGQDNEGKWSLEVEYGTPDAVTASLYPKVGMSYTNGISDLDEVTLNAIAYKISSNDKITDATSVVYYDSGSLHRKISIGDKVDITVNSATYSVQIVGFNHDNLADGEAYGEVTATRKAGMTFQLVDCLATSYAMATSNNNSGGWASCAMRTSSMPQFLSTCSNDLQTHIKVVNKLTTTGRGTSVARTEDKLFLLSEVEVFGSFANSVAGEGVQYAYYKAGNSKIKKVNGSAFYWWERSSWNGSSSEFCLVWTDGSSSSASASGKYGVSFAFCI